MSYTQKKSGQLQAGDVIQLWSEAKTITHFEAHPGLTRDGIYHPARVACSGEWGITCFDNDTVRKTSLGTWIAPHLWFAFERKYGRKTTTAKA